MRLGISEKNIHRWKTEGTCEKRETGKLTGEEKEIRRLHKEIERLQMEKEILKKAAAFFASEPK